MGWWEGRAWKAEWDRVWEMGGCCFKARKGPEQGCLCQRAGARECRCTWPGV